MCIRLNRKYVKNKIGIKRSLIDPIRCHYRTVHDRYSTIAILCHGLLTSIRFLPTGSMDHGFLDLGPWNKVEGNDTSPVAFAAPDLGEAADTGPLEVETAD